MLGSVLFAGLMHLELRPCCFRNEPCISTLNRIQTERSLGFQPRTSLIQSPKFSYYASINHLHLAELHNYSLCFGVEDVGGPAVHEARVPCEPQHHHEDEECQDADLAVTHGSQPPVLLPECVVRGFLLVGLGRAAAPGLLQAAEETTERVQGSAAKTSCLSLLWRRD